MCESDYDLTLRTTDREAQYACYNFQGIRRTVGAAAFARGLGGRGAGGLQTVEPQDLKCMEL